MPDAQTNPLELVGRLQEDFEFFCETCLLVEDKQTQELVPFRLKPVQKRLAEKMLERWARGAPVRLIILKARREGVSTLVQALFFWVCATRRNRRAFTIAQDEDTTKYLHEMSERYYENMPPPFRPQRRTKLRGTILEFANPSKNPDDQRDRPGLNSTLRTATLNNAGAGKGSTLLHLSELALWPKEQAPKTLNTVLQIVPRAGRTVVVIESTARGLGGEFHSRWVAAEQQHPDQDYEAFFIPWFEEPTFRVPAPEGFEETLTQDERNVMDEFDLEIDQMFWRRLTIANECGGSLDVFHQEYPATPAEAFLASGRDYFTKRGVAYHWRKAKATPIWKRGELLEEAGWITFQERARGLVTIWEPPQPHEDYLIFCDSSEGSGGDYQAAYVMCRSRPAKVASWYGRVDRDELGEQMYRLGKLYNTALVAIEISGGWGMVPVYHLKARGYPRIYRRRRSVASKHQKRSELMGFDTTVLTRPLMLDTLNKALRTEEYEPNDPGLLEECNAFVYNDDGKPEASPGFHDDKVVAASGAMYLWTTEPIHRPTDKVLEKRRAPLSAVTGY